tara:strand:- start:47045 stop:48418 length:1374 start_codon:yes stop_codon:yes gene_type:complete
MRATSSEFHTAHKDVLTLAATYPAQQPLVVLHSGGSSSPWARWSMLASPRGHLKVLDDGFEWSGQSWPELEEALAGVPANDPLAIMDAAIAADQAISIEKDPSLPFMGGWVISLRYELGAHIERVTNSDADLPRGVLADFLWCPDAIVHDAYSDKWWSIGEPQVFDPVIAPDQPLHMDEWKSHPDRRGYEEAVSRTIELIRRGDLFQANITRQISTNCRGGLREFALKALSSSGAWFGCWMELADSGLDRAILGMSPELFLDLDAASGTLRSRPIKGTRPAEASVMELAGSEKDAAELNMIVDLMRNDLGRVCELGSIGVSQPRSIESHPTVHHGVAEICGQLTPGTRFSEILRATFPPGSVTGAPKIRAMQVIDELEQSPRGPYCGAVGCLSTSGDLRLGVSIRTAAFEGNAKGGFHEVEGRLVYGTGCGIVVDSDPTDEFTESQHKTAALMRLLD